MATGNRVEIIKRVAGMWKYSCSSFSTEDKSGKSSTTDPESGAFYKGEHKKVFEYAMNTYSTTNRDGYREYKSDANKCKDCPYRNRCTESKNHVKVVIRHIWENYMEQVEDIRHTTGSREIYKKRKETIERVFADAKGKHAMRYTQYRGLAKVKMELNPLFACMN